jgi:ParB-like chromosome segregation protein Spo0J
MPALASSEPGAPTGEGGAASGELRHLPLASLVDDGTDVRKDVGDLTLLRASLTPDAPLRPLLVRPRPDLGMGMFGVVVGKQRWMALVQLAQKQGKALDAVTVPALIRPMTEVDALVASLKENLGPHDLSPRELYEALERLKRADPERFGTYEALGHVIGKDRKYVERIYAAVEVELATGTVVVRQERRKAPGLTHELPIGHAQRLVETVRALDLPDDARKQKMQQLVQAVTGLTRRRAEALFAQFLRNPEVDIARVREQVVVEAPEAPEGQTGPFPRSYTSGEVGWGLGRASRDYSTDTLSLMLNIAGTWLEARGYLRSPPPERDSEPNPGTELGGEGSPA